MLVCLILWLLRSLLKNILFHNATLSGWAPLLCASSSSIQLLNPYIFQFSFNFCLVLSYIFFLCWRSDCVHPFFFSFTTITLNSHQVVYLCLIKVFLEIKGLPVCGPSMCPTCCGRVAAAVWVWVELSPSGWLGHATVATEISRALSEGHTQALADFQWSSKVLPSISKIGRSTIVVLPREDSPISCFSDRHFKISKWGSFSFVLSIFPTGVFVYVSSYRVSESKSFKRELFISCSSPAFRI